MKELYENIGFNENPFARFSAEEEIAYLKNIFLKPKYYSTIHSDVKSGTSRFIFGERGIGKSALIITLMSDFSNNNIFSVLIDDYEGIPTIDNEKELLILAMKKIVTLFGLYLVENESCLKNLDNKDKEKLALFINVFFETISEQEFDDLYNKTTHIKTKNAIKHIFNTLLLKPINITVSGCSDFLGSTISRCLGLPEQVSQSVYKEYIPKLEISSCEKQIDPCTLDLRKIKIMIKELSNIIKKTGFLGVAIIFDKIDEYRKLGTKISTITDFIKDLALDTAFLLDSDFSLVFSFLSGIKQPLIDEGLRCDKLKPIDITWTNSELLTIINDRLNYFSSGKITSLWDIVSCKYEESIFTIVNQSPRQLIILLSKIYDEQANIDCSNPQLTNQAVDEGIANFAKTFDFVTYYAGVTPKLMKRMVLEILKVHNLEFGSKDLVAVLKISSPAANRKIQDMLNYGLIKNLNVSTRPNLYRIKDPRLICMIKANIDPDFL